MPPPCADDFTAAATASPSPVNQHNNQNEEEIDMNRIALEFFTVICVLASILFLGSEYAQAQTQDQVAKFDATGNPVDSVITEASGQVGIGLPNDGRYPSNVVQIFGQDGLRITGYQPFLTLEDTNSFNNRRGVIQSVDGSIHFYPNSYIGRTPPLTILNDSY